MSALHHHQPAYVATLEAERRDQARDSELARLVRAAAGGEEAAWSTLVNRFTRRLTRVVQSHRVPAHDVDDVVQNTFIRLYENLGSLRNPDALPAWLDTTARRETLRSIRAMLRERPLDIAVIEDLPAPTAPRVGQDEELSAEFERALDALPKRQRSLLQALVHSDEPSYEEIAVQLEMPIGSIGPTRGRALERLRSNLALREAASDAAEDRSDGGGVSHVPYWSGAAAQTLPLGA